jgi:hypothetical protein
MARASFDDNGRVPTNKPFPNPEQQSAEPQKKSDEPESVDPNDSALERDQLKGQTTQPAKPPRLEDEGQSGG